MGDGSYCFMYDRINILYISYMVQGLVWEKYIHLSSTHATDSTVEYLFFQSNNCFSHGSWFSCASAFLITCWQYNHEMACTTRFSYRSINRPDNWNIQLFSDYVSKYIC